MGILGAAVKWGALLNVPLFIMGGGIGLLLSNPVMGMGYWVGSWVITFMICLPVIAIVSFIRPKKTPSQ